MDLLEYLEGPDQKKLARKIATSLVDALYALHEETGGLFRQASSIEDLRSRQNLFADSINTVAQNHFAYLKENERIVALRAGLEAEWAKENNVKFEVKKTAKTARVSKTIEPEVKRPKRAGREFNWEIDESLPYLALTASIPEYGITAKANALGEWSVGLVSGKAHAMSLHAAKYLASANAEFAIKKTAQFLKLDEKSTLKDSKDAKLELAIKQAIKEIPPTSWSDVKVGNWVLCSKDNYTTSGIVAAITDNVGFEVQEEDSGNLIEASTDWDLHGVLDGSAIKAARAQRDHNFAIASHQSCGNCGLLADFSDVRWDKVARKNRPQYNCSCGNVQWEVTE